MARKQSFTLDNIKEWPRLFKKLPARQQQAFYMILVCALVFVIVAVTSTLLIFGGKNTQEDASVSISGSTPPESGYDKDANSIKPKDFDDVILPKTADAGQKYMDETLFVGDSNTVRLHDVYKLVPLENYMGMVGMTIQGAVSAPCVFFQNDITVYTIPKAIAMVQPRRIVMCFGTNNASGETSTDNFIKNYKIAIQSIQEEYPHCDIIVASIPPCGLDRDYPNVSQKTIDEFNKALVKMCKSLKLKYLNMAEELKDTKTGYIKADYISTDGLHLSETGDRAWLTYVRTHAYDTKDKRPTVKNVPVRQEPPAPKAGTPVPPTCTENGYTPYTLWDGTVDKRDVVPALDHKYVNGICERCGVKDPKYVAPSSSASSSKPASSSSSSSSAPPVSSSSSSAPPVSSSSSSAPPAHVHAFTAGAIKTPATCGADGVQIFTCTCGASEERPIPKTGAHTWAWIEDKKATETEAGLKHEECTVCHAKQNENTPIPQLPPPAPPVTP
ncbi:MAG: GDSL-type esterase/lipase family protein [Ruthenibacterium sp.]